MAEQGWHSLYEILHGKFLKGVLTFCLAHFTQLPRRPPHEVHAGQYGNQESASKRSSYSKEELSKPFHLNRTAEPNTSSLSRIASAHAPGIRVRFNSLPRHRNSRRAGCVDWNENDFPSVVERFSMEARHDTAFNFNGIF
jgi:hypothetical protein